MIRQHLGIGIAMTIYLLAFGFLIGMAGERIRFDRRRSVAVERFESTAEVLRAQMMAAERASTRTFSR